MLVVIASLCPKSELKEDVMKKTHLADLSNNGERRKRLTLALKKGEKPFDKVAYQKKYNAKRKKARQEWKEWF